MPPVRIFHIAPPLEAIIHGTGPGVPMMTADGEMGFAKACITKKDSGAVLRQSPASAKTIGNSCG
jgi:hypothetical protein